MTNKFMLRQIRKVAFFGDAEIKEGSLLFEEVRRGARLLAERGYEIVNGGGPGVMEAATKGAREGGGKVVTVLLKDKEAVGFEKETSKNKGDVEMVYDNYPDRLKGLLEEGDVYLLFKGGTGTLSELGMVWVMAKLYYGKHKPFILVGDYWRKLVRVVFEVMSIDAKERELVHIVEKVEEAVEMIERWKREGGY